MYFPTAYNPPFGTFIGRGGGFAARGGGFVGRGGGLARGGGFVGRGGGFVGRGGGFAARGGSQLRPQFALEDLSGGRARQRAGELHGLRALEVGQPLPRPGNDRLGRRLGAGHRDDHGVHGLAPHRIGPPDDSDLGHGRVIGEHGLHLRRVDVLAAADDHVLGAVHDVEVAVGGQPADVPGPVPAARRERGR